MGLVAWIVVFFFSTSLPALCLAEGAFELRLLSYHNEFAHDIEGVCCEGERNSRTGKCDGDCATLFRICLKQFQRNIDPQPPCHFGSRQTPVLGANRIDFAHMDNFPQPLRFPFTMAWPETFTLIVEAWNNKTKSVEARKVPLLRYAEAKFLEPSRQWQKEEHRFSGSHVSLEYRVLCAANNYGPRCSAYCRPRDDNHGHHSCDPIGNKVCIDGWKGEYCDQPICREGCHSENGMCHRPGECLCKTGWQGPLCADCQRYPSCLHGTCTEPFKCDCDEGWGGLFCNQDLNFCTHHTPCENSGVCTNTGQGHYTCTCQPGFTGTNCEVDIETCDQSPCLNGAHCSESEEVGNYSCACLNDFSGKHCQISAQTCAEAPCQNGASCIELIAGGYKCLCADGWYGDNCDTETKQCRPNPCQNGGRCVEKFNGFECVCDLGFKGKRCEINVDDCVEKACLHGGACLDLVNGFKCQCAPGWMGSVCQENINDCLAMPCSNGATCYDMVDDYRCACRAGFAGKDCSVNVDVCASQPCFRPGAICERGRFNSYQCRCPPCFSGRQCEIENHDCLWEVTFQPVNVTTAQPPSPSAPATQSSSRLNTAIMLPITGALALALLALALVLLCVAWRLWRRANNKEELGELERAIRQNANNERVEFYLNNRFGPPAGRQENQYVELDAGAAKKICNLEPVGQPISAASSSSLDYYKRHNLLSADKAVSVDKLSTFKTVVVPSSSSKSDYAQVHQQQLVKKDVSCDSGLGDSPKKEGPTTDQRTTVASLRTFQVAAQRHRHPPPQPPSSSPPPPPRLGVHVDHANADLEEEL